MDIAGPVPDERELEIKMARMWAVKEFPNDQEAQDQYVRGWMEAYDVSHAGIET